MASQTAPKPKLKRHIEYYEAPTPPDLSEIVIEDGKPVDNMFSENQMRLLVDPLLASWGGPPSHKFIAAANVGIFYAVGRPAIVPDVLLSLDVKNGDDPSKKENLAYFTWIHGKAPDVAIEIVSNKEGNETGSKLLDYAQIGVRYYVIYDPELFILKHPLRILRLNGRKYSEFKSHIFEDLKLGLTLWKGKYGLFHATWLRWTNAKGELFPAITDLKSRAEQEHERAKQEHARADQERLRADRLAAKLRKLGHNPEL